MSCGLHERITQSTLLRHMPSYWLDQYSKVFNQMGFPLTKDGVDLAVEARLDILGLIQASLTQSAKDEWFIQVQRPRGVFNDATLDPKKIMALPGLLNWYRYINAVAEPMRELYRQEGYIWLELMKDPQNRRF